VFWSLSDGSGGRTQPAPALTETVGSSPLTLIAWYYLPASGHGNGNGGSAVLIDAYSVQNGNFVDDDFVTVLSDPSLTLSANVDGVVPTGADQSVQAYGQIPTGERFDEWMTSAGGTSAAGDLLTAPQGSGGLAIATYHRMEIQKPKDVPVEGWRILFGIVNDAGGFQIPLGGGPPVPVGPWDPTMRRLVSALAVHAAAAGLSKAAAGRIQQAAAAEVAEAAKALSDSAKKGFR
jgi:hypothetical protein